MSIRAGFCRRRCTSSCRLGIGRISCAARCGMSSTSRLYSTRTPRSAATRPTSRHDGGASALRLSSRPVLVPTSGAHRRRSAPPRPRWRRKPPIRPIRPNRTTRAGRVHPPACAGKAGPCAVRMAVRRIGHSTGTDDLMSSFARNKQKPRACVRSASSGVRARSASEPARVAATSSPSARCTRPPPPPRRPSRRSSPR